MRNGWVTWWPKDDAPQVCPMCGRDDVPAGELGHVCGHGELCRHRVMNALVIAKSDLYLTAEKIEWGRADCAQCDADPSRG